MFFIISRHKLAVVFEEVYQFLGDEVLRAAGVEALVDAEACDDGLEETLLGIAVSLHHGEDFVSVGYNLQCVNVLICFFVNRFRLQR